MKHLWTGIMIIAAVFLLPAMTYAQEEADYTQVTDIECAAESLPELAEDVAAQNSDGTIADTDARFATGRIIVEAGDVPDTYGAISVWQLGDDETVLEYETAADAEAAFGKLKKTYECYPDEILCIESSGTDIDLTMGMSALRGEPLGRDVTVAVLDTGIDSNNGMVKGRISDASYDFITGSDTLIDGDKAHKHGTYVAGTVAELTPDNVDIMALRIQNGGDASSANMTTLLLVGSAMKHALANGADVINMSFDLDPVSGSTSALNYLDGIMEDAWEQGVVCCVASGNDEHAINESDYPACVSTAVTVGSVDEAGNVSKFSNYGKYIDFTAPGQLDQQRVGTSFAAPGIAACFAYLRGSMPQATADELYEALRTLCADKGDAGWDDHYGWGIPQMQIGEMSGREEKKVIKAATCTESGSVQYGSRVETIPATGHTWTAAKENGGLVFRCKACGRETAEPEGESWRIVYAGDNISKEPVAQLEISGNVPEADSYPWECAGDYITQVVIKDDVTSIPEGAFRGMKYLSNVTHIDDMEYGMNRSGLPEGLTSIGSGAFEGCSNLKELHIGKNVETIGPGAFAGCTRLADLSVSEENSSFAAEGRCLYNKEKTTLLFCSDEAGAYADTVTSIAPEAFRGQRITAAEIGENVETIGAGAFAGCGNLRTVNFTGTAARTIGEDAFGHVNADVYVPENVSGNWTGKGYGGQLRWHETTLNEGSVTVTLAGGPWTYTREEIRPAVTVKKKDGTATLNENDDYILAYSSNVAPGTGQVMIIGKDNGWSGVVTRNFEIKKAQFNFNKVAVPEKIHANQELIVKYNGVAIKEMPDLDVEYRSEPSGMFVFDDATNKLLMKKKGAGKLIIIADTNEYYEADLAGEYDVTVLACESGKHVWDKGKVTRKATYTKAGVRTYTCSNCGDKKTSSIARLKGAAVGTKYKKGSLTYKVKSGSVLQVTASKNVKSVTIPKTVTINKKTYKVTSIGAKAFYKKSKLKTLKIRSTTIKSVGKNAFGKLPKKAVVKVPKSKLKSYRSMVRKAGFKGKKQKVKAL